MAGNLIATTAGSCDSKDDINHIAGQLAATLADIPRLVIASYSSLCDHQSVISGLKNQFPDSAVMGASTCRGALTATGVVAFGQANLSLWGLCDQDGDYGVGFAELANDAVAATQRALEGALEHCSREGELPDLVWMHASPGQEELVVATIDDYFGGDVLIVGGSAADETLEANWTCFAGTDVGTEGVSIAVMFSSYEVSTSFQSGYLPTASTGVATRCEGRTVFEIDHQPAAEVYNRWADNLVDLDNVALPANVLGCSTLSPLGVAVGDVSGIPYFSLVHPETYTEDLALTFFCEVQEGDKLTLMSGSVDNIVSRPGRVANEAIFHPEAGDGDVVGGLVVFCGGCLLAVEPRAEEISTHLNESMQGSAYLGCFTFGEQGCLLGGENRHGNLMISVTVFKHAA